MTFWPFRFCRLAVLAPLLVVGVLQACAPNEEQPSTGAPPVEAPAEEPTTPTAPESQLPSGLALGSGDIEMRSAGDLAARRVMLQRPEMGGTPVRVALLVPLSGQAASVGQQLKDAAEMALFDQREARLVLLPKDTASTPEGAAKAAREAIAEGAELIVGPLFAAHVSAVNEAAKQASVPVLTFSNDVSVAAPGTYVLGIAPRLEVRAVVEFALSHGHRRVAALLPDSDYGRLIHRALQESLAESPGELGRVAFYPPGAEADDETLLQAARNFADYDLRKAALQRERSNLRARGDAFSRAALKRLEHRDTLGDPPYEAVLLAEPGGRLTTIAPLLAYYDVDQPAVRLLGLGSWYSPDLGREPSLVGAWFPGPNPDLFATFEQRFQQQFGEEPSRVASLGYDAIAMAAALVRDTPPTERPFTTSRLTDPDGFAAYYGAFRLTETGRSERLLPILEVESEGFRVVGQPPQTFEPLIN